MEFIDHLNRTITLSKLPERIISLVPSQTELLVDLGLEEKLVGVTKFCVHPKHLRKTKTIVGGTKNYRFEVIDSLKPDLIIGNKEENERESIERLAENYPVWISDIRNLEDAYRMIEDVGKLTGTQNRAELISKEIKQTFDIPVPKKGTGVYLIWKEPWITAGKETFIDEMLRIAGFENLIPEIRYPSITLEELVGLGPDFLLLSSEPYPFKESHCEELKKFFPNSRILLVDGELFSWYGTRLRYSSAYFQSLK
jgi:ABC-type Fe3+-hydroxamate transport system substrate-binding protein